MKRIVLFIFCLVAVSCRTFTERKLKTADIESQAMSQPMAQHSVVQSAAIGQPKNQAIESKNRNREIRDRKKEEREQYEKNRKLNEQLLYVHLLENKGINGMQIRDVAGNFYWDHLTYPDDNNVNVPLSLFEEIREECDSFYYSGAILPGAFTCSSDPESIVLVLNEDSDSTNIYGAKSKTDKIAVIHEKRIAGFLDYDQCRDEESWVKIKVKDDTGKEIIGWINCKILGNKHGFDANAFILNKPGESVILYLDKGLTKKRIELGCLVFNHIWWTRVWVNGKVDDGILELEYSGEKTYCRVGDICVMTDKGKNAFLILRAEPDNGSQAVGETSVNQCAIVLDATDDWLKVRLLTKDGIFADGWIPNEMTYLPYY